MVTSSVTMVTSSVTMVTRSVTIVTSSVTMVTSTEYYYRMCLSVNIIIILLSRRPFKVNVTQYTVHSTIATHIKHSLHPISSTIT